LPVDSHGALERLCRASGNPEGIFDDLARLMAVHPKIIPTGAAMRGEDPAIVGKCLVDLANSNRPTWNSGYFRGMIETAKANRVPRATAQRIDSAEQARQWARDAA
jgi:hypothetical protein